MIQELLREQRLSLDPYFERLDCARADALLQLLISCKGTVVCSGVGKSGHIAQKIAATFLSTGTKAFFLDPMHAAHGDLGYVSETDVFLAFSKSGETDELLGLLPFIRKKKAKTVAIVSNPRSRLALQSDLAIELPFEKELCPFDLAPTTSTAVQLLFGDCLAIALMRSKQVSLGDYALNHPGGLIGRRIALKVFDLMLKNEQLPLCKPMQKLIEVLPELSAKRCGCLLVVDESHRLIGIFTDGDLRRALETRGSASLEASVQELMTASPRFISPGLSAWDAMRKMEENPSRLITVLPVVENRRVVGLLRMHDVLQAGLS